MIEITLPDNSKKQFNNSVSAIEVAKSIGSGLAKATVAAKVNGKLIDATDLIAVSYTHLTLPTSR